MPLPVFSPIGCNYLIVILMTLILSYFLTEMRQPVGNQTEKNDYEP